MITVVDIAVRHPRVMSSLLVAVQPCFEFLDLVGRLLVMICLKMSLRQVRVEYISRLLDHY